MKTPKLILTLLLCLFSTAIFAQLNVIIVASDANPCKNESIYMHPKINSGSPTIFHWTANGADITFLGGDSISVLATNDSFTVGLASSDGVNTVNAYTKIVTKPVPEVSLTRFQNYTFCDTDPDLKLPTATPLGGSWSCSNTSALVGVDTFSPSSADYQIYDFWFRYTYVDTSNGCSDIDSIPVRVDQSQEIYGVLDDSARLGLSEDYIYPRNITATDSRFIRIVESNFYGNANQISNLDFKDGILTFKASFDTCETFRFVITAMGIGACNDADKTLDIHLCRRGASIKKIHESKLPEVYPNPSNGSFNIIGNQQLSYTLFSTLGEDLGEVTLDESSSFYIDLPGIYILKFTNQQGAVGVKRLVVQQ